MLVFLLTDITNDILRAEPRPEGLDLALYQYHTLVEKCILQFDGDGVRHLDTKVFAVLDPEDALRCALEISRQTHPKPGEFDLSPHLRIALHAGEAHHVEDEYLGIDRDRSFKLLEAARGGHVLLSEAASQAMKSPPGTRFRSLGMHLLKDLFEPQELFALTTTEMSFDELKLPVSLSSFKHNLEPQSMPFFGRLRELSEVGAFLKDPLFRLLTLQSSGGFGKSRLALQAAADNIESFPGGVYVINLASVRTEEQLLFNIAEGMRLNFYGTGESKQQVLDYLREKEMLLVLDNFEQIVAGPNLVQEILQAAAKLKILVTSRQRLRIPEEKAYEVGGLELPKDMTESNIERYPAIQLFIKAAQKAKPDFDPSPAEVVRAYGICRLLDGMPLGIELAAARVPNHSLSEIHRQIESNQEALATGPTHIPERHRSLRAVYEYSWGLLTEPHQHILMALSVFRSPFKAEAAQVVAKALPADLEFLADRSLLIQRENTFQFQAIVKYYAKEKLFDRAEIRRETEEDHARYFAGYTGERIHEQSALNQRQLLDELATVIEDVQAAWKWALDNTRSQEIGQMADGLQLFYEVRGFFREGRDAFEKASNLLSQKGVWPRDLKLYAKTLFSAGYFCQKMGLETEATRYFMASLDAAKLSPRMHSEMGYASLGLGLVAEDKGDFKIAYGHLNVALTYFERARLKTGQAFALNTLSRLLAQMGENAKSRRLALKGLQLFESLHDTRGTGWSYILLGNVAMSQSRYLEAKQHYQKGLTGYVDFGDRSGIAWAFVNLGNISMILGEYNGAHQLFREAQIINRELGDRRALAYTFILLGRVAMATGEYEDAEHLFNEGKSLYQTIGDKRGVGLAWELTGNLSCIRNDVDEAEHCYREAESANQDNPNDTIRGWRHFHFGVVEQLRGRLEEAVQLLERSMDYFRRTGDNHSLAVALSQLGKVTFEQKQYLISEKNLKKALFLMVKAGYVSRSLDYLISLARILALKGEKETAYRIMTYAYNHQALRQEDRDRYREFYTWIQENTPEDVVLEILEGSDQLTLESLAAEVLDVPDRFEADLSSEAEETGRKGYAGKEAHPGRHPRKLPVAMKKEKARDRKARAPSKRRSRSKPKRHR